MKDIINVENLSFDYSDAKVLKDISFRLFEGDFLGIIGANGAGKSTLLKLLLGILPQKSGKISIAGGMSECGYVSQKAASFNSGFPATVYEAVIANRYGKRGLFKRFNALDRERTEKALRLVGMWDFKDRLIGRLSGGQQQRVFIARAIVCEPSVLIMDEPTVGVDVQSVQAINKIIDDLNKDGMTIIMTNHDTPALVKAANKLLILCEHGNGEFVNKKELTPEQLDSIVTGRRAHNHA